ncbi:MAG TPA: NAD-dependent deacylase [Chloroflexi bacterium]|nr:NAD-dependent deacylase [Chloroflexota bacterium]HPO58876.1 NAD-dependent deacylase [Anaerolineaceae bacterium]
MTPSFDELVAAAAEKFRQARYAVALTGAGMSTPSGIPDFRSQGTGLWTQNDPMRVASLTAFRYRPQAFYNWLRPLVRQIWQAQPNPGHMALAELESLDLLKAVVTQNIDLLHQRAGSKEVIPVHGSMETFSCLRCRNVVSSDSLIDDLLNTERNPLCPNCGAVLKPDIVLFEELLPEDAWRRAETHFRRADLVLVAGSSLEVMPAGGLPLFALENGAEIIINTLSSTYLDGEASLLLPFDIAQTLPAVVRQLSPAG